MLLSENKVNLLVAQRVFLHEETENDGCTTRNTGVAMDKSPATSGKAVVKEDFDLLKVLNDVLCDRIRDIDH